MTGGGGVVDKELGGVVRNRCQNIKQLFVLSEASGQNGTSVVIIGRGRSTRLSSGPREKADPLSRCATESVRSWVGVGEHRCGCAQKPSAAG